MSNEVLLTLHLVQKIGQVKSGEGTLAADSICQPCVSSDTYFLVALLVGIGYMQWLELRNPGALQKGAMMLTHTSLAPEINLECDKTVTAL